MNLDNNPKVENNIKFEENMQELLGKMKHQTVAQHRFKGEKSQW